MTDYHLWYRVRWLLRIYYFQVRKAIRWELRRRFGWRVRDSRNQRITKELLAATPLLFSPSQNPYSFGDPQVDNSNNHASLAQLGDPRYAGRQSLMDFRKRYESYMHDGIQNQSVSELQQHQMDAYQTNYSAFRATNGITIAPDGAATFADTIAVTGPPHP